MKKEEETIKTYKELIGIFTKLSNQTDNMFLAEKSKEFVADFTTQLSKYEKKDNVTTTPEETEEEKKVDTTNPTEKEEDEYFNYINNAIRSDANLKEQLDRLTNKVIEDLENPTDELIEVWVRNYKDFVVTNNLNEEYMIKYMLGIFEKYDVNRDYIDHIEELYEQIELETPDLDTEKTEGISTEDKKENTEENKNNSEDKKENTEENKNNSEDEKENTEENKNNPEDEKENTEENKTNPEDEKENTEENKTNPEDKKENTEEKRKKVKIHRYKEKTTERPIKIVSTKKAFLNTGEKLGAGVAAIACLSTPIITPAILVAYMIYKLRKNHNYKNYLLEDFLEKNGYEIDLTTKELYTIDENGNKVVINEEMLEKAEYSHIKKELMEIGAIRSGFIPEDYKKSKLLQTLMKLNPVRKLKELKHKHFEKLKAIHKPIKYTEQQQVKRDLKDLEYYEDEEELKSGMRRL